MPLTPASEINDIQVLPTGTFLDNLTGIGGLPRGRIVEFWGEQNTGKSSAALQTIVAAQKLGLKCLYVDIEFSLSTEYAEKLGVDMDKLMVLREGTAEEYIDAVEAFVKDGKFDVIVLDSIGDLSSRISNNEKKAGEKTIGMQASLMSTFSRHIAPYVALNKILFIGVNHARMEIMGVYAGKVYQMGGKKWSEKKKLSIRFREKSGVSLKVGETVVGRVIRVSVSKNHVGNTDGKEMEARLLNGQGFATAANLLQQALDADVFDKTGNTYHFKGVKIGTKAKLEEWAKENEALIKEALNT